MLFLLTADGVRQVTAELDFGTAQFHDQERTNYRFDAVSSVRVAEADDDRRAFELTLVDGTSISVRVTEPGTPSAEDSLIASKVTLDSAGIANTLHVLEGIAAEGKEWIKHEARRENGRMTILRESVHSMLG